MRHHLGAAVSVGILLFVTGCVGRQRFVYPRHPESQAPPIEREGVCVGEFRDLRGPVNHDLKLLALIPGIPFSVSYRETPEQTPFDFSRDLYGFRPAEDLAKALADELADQHLFSQCGYVGRGSAPSRFVLSGTLVDLHSSEGYLTYGISFLSVIPHLLFFPEGTIRGAIVIDLVLQDQAQAGRVIWRRRIEAQRTRLTWIYASDEADSLMSIYSSIAAEEIPKACRELGAFLEKREAPAKE